MINIVTSNFNRGMFYRRKLCNKRCITLNKRNTENVFGKTTVSKTVMNKDPKRKLVKVSSNLTNEELNKFYLNLSKDSH